MIYLDNAATTFPKPRVVIESVHRAVEFYGGNPGRSGHSFAMRVSEKIYMVRKTVADMFGDSLMPEQVIFTSNCTSALNMAIKGSVTRGDHVIISSVEHNSVFRPIYKLKADGIITYDIATVYDDSTQTVAKFESLINPRTKAIVCMHASNVSGVVLPIAKLGALCKKYGILFIVDAAQTAGVIPINMNDMNIDILCTAGHKGLYGITGTGVMIVRGNRHLTTLIEGGTGNLSAIPEQPEDYPERMESGTLNTPGILSLGAGIGYINSIGIANLYAHEFAVCKRVFGELSRFSQIAMPISRFEPYKNMPVIAFNIGRMASEEAVAELNAAGFALRGGLHCSPLAHQHYNTIDTGMVRFSPSIFTSEQSIDAFLKTIRKLIKKTGYLT